MASPTRLTTTATVSDEYGQDVEMTVSGHDEASEIVDVLSDSENDDGEVDEAEEEDYEASRLRRIQENQILLSQLGIFGTETNAVASSSSVRTATATKKRKPNPTKYDRSGYILSLPNPGEVHRMACVEMPSDRKIRKRIADGQYADCSRWAEGEERRWRFGDGTNLYQQGEEVTVGGVGPDFRWRKWRGLNHERRDELKKLGELTEADTKGTTVVEEEGSAYSRIPGESCHQCRRKSEKNKMRCRNTNPECKALFCSSCCKRYSYFDFDPDSRSFICPLCQNKCNCSICIRKRNLSHLLEKNGERVESLTRKLKRQGQSGTVQEFLEAEEKVEVPFDRVRLVCQEEDIISPELPPEPKPVKSKVVKKPRKSDMTSTGPKLKGSSVQKKKTKQGRQSNGPLLLRFKVPPATLPVIAKQVRVKEVDSDGDTVQGWSDDDDDGHRPDELGSASPTSSLTALSSLSATPPRRLAFPPRPPAPLSSTTTNLAQIMDVNIDGTSSRGYIRPEDMQANGHGESEIVHKRKKPPPGATILRAPKYMTHPETSVDEQALGSSSGSSQTGNQPEEANHDGDVFEKSAYTNGNGHEVPQGTSILDQSSSPDPLSMPIASYTIDKGERGVANDIFLNEAIPYNHSPRRTNRLELDPDEESSPDNAGRDPLFPDAPLWYAYTHQNESPRVARS